MSGMTPLEDIDPLEAMRKAAASGEPYRRPSEIEATGVLYEPGDIVCSLTLDQKQAWVVYMLLAPYKAESPDQWDIFRAADDVRRRLAEAMGYE